MEKLINIQIKKLPEGAFLATSDDIQGLVAQGRTLWETMEIARDVAKRLLEARNERKSRKAPNLHPIGKNIELPLVLEY
jgi:predicted RNase H-like HicB family nuclease